MRPAYVILLIIISIAAGSIASYFLFAFPAKKTNREIKRERNDFEERFNQSQVIIDSITDANVILADEKNKYIAFSDSMIRAINKRSPGLVLIKNYEDRIVGSIDIMAQLRAYSDFLAQTDSLSR